MPARLLYTGQVVIDLVMGLDHLPASGGDVLARSAQFETGGGFNTMAAAARNGLATVYLGRHGQGRFGDLARHAMAVEGIEVLAAVDTSQDTGLSVALIEPSAERSFISYVGAEGGLSSADLASATPRAGDYVFVSGYSLLHPGKVECLLEWVLALPQGCTVVFDPGPLIDKPDAPAMQRLLPRIDLWTCNREEAERFTGCAHVEDAMARFQQLLDPDALTLLRDGPQGCWLGQGGRIERVPGHAVTALDTNGAGDAHAGVMLAGLARGLSPAQAARRANIGAALAVTRWGPATAPLASEIDDILSQG